MRVGVRGGKEGMKSEVGGGVKEGRRGGSEVVGDKNTTPIFCEILLLIWFDPAHSLNHRPLINTRFRIVLWNIFFRARFFKINKIINILLYAAHHHTFT